MLRTGLGVVAGVLAWSVLPAAADEGRWQWPLAGPHELSRPFAPPATRYAAGHRGVDLPAAPGAVVRAAGAGRVSYAGLLAGRGVVVVVHGDLRTTYEPVTSLHPVGARVAAGEPIGRVVPGHAGCPSEACLHWGLRRGEQYLDPTRLVERGPVRLLPVTVGPAGPPAATRVRREPQAVRPVAPAVPASGQQVSDPGWSLRSSELPLGAAAVAALVLGIGLLARPRPAPSDPAGGSAGSAAAPPPAPPEPAPPLERVLDLDAARLRRQAS